MQLTGTARQKPLKLFGPSVAPVVLFVLVPCVLVDSARLRIRYSFKLALPAQVGFELCEHAEHIEEAFARRGAGVDWLLSRLQGRTAIFSLGDC